MQESATVFLVDDESSVRRSMGRLLRASGLKCESFESADKFLRSPRYDGTSCLLLDQQMEGLSGTDLQCRLAENGCDMPIIFLSGHGNVPISVKAMKQGALDFLAKPVDGQTLIDTIHRALAEHEKRRQEQRELKEIRDRVARLTPREYEVMRGVIGGALNKQIAATLNIVEQTVKVHRHQVMSKMGVPSVAELVRLCVRAGITPVAME